MRCESGGFTLPATTLTGSRIRERRIAQGLRQTALAQTVGISPAYLNLIEHNKRRIGGKLLVKLGRALEIDPAQLAEGAEATLLAALREASDWVPDSEAEMDRIDEFAGQFAGWAGLIVSQRRQIAALEHSVETLTDRLAHDPHLAASLHDLLSSVTAINATASILVETEDIAGAWRDRFHRNLAEDSTRLADSAQALVAYLDEASDTALGARSPQDEVEMWLESRGYHLPELERAPLAGVEAVLRDAPQIKSAAARDLAERVLQRYRADAEKLPLPDFAAAAADCDPLQLAERFGADLAAVLRRIAALPQAEGQPRTGLVVCDGSGTLTFRKPAEGFALPTHGAACPLWPLFQALGRPMVPVRAIVEMAGRDASRFLTYAVAQPLAGAGYDRPPVFEATMLIIPADRVATDGQPVQKVGTSCRICPRARCEVRREPSVLVDPG